MSNLPTKRNDLNLTPRITEIVEYVFANPTLTQKQVADVFKVHESRISQVLNHPRVLEAYPILAKRKIQGMVPKALKRFDQLMNQDKNLEVSRKVAERALESAKVLENNQNISVKHSYEGMKTEDLARIIAKTKELQIQITEAEVIENSDDPK